MPFGCETEQLSPSSFANNASGTEPANSTPVLATGQGGAANIRAPLRHNSCRL